MTCLRCQGLMVEEHLLDFEGTYGHMWASGFRCMNCGHVHDPVIAQNAQTQQAKVQVLVAVSDEQDYADDEVPVGAASFFRQAA